MKCFFCGANVVYGKDKCDFCGKYQHDANRKDEEPDPKDSEEYKKQVINQNRKSNLLLIICVLLAFVAIVCAVLFVNKDEKDFYGTWKCNDDVTMKFDSDTFTLDEDSLHLEASYLIDNTTNTDNRNIYILYMTAKKRIINGEEDKSEFTTEYEIIIREKEKTEMRIGNTTSGNTYICHKEK